MKEAMLASGYSEIYAKNPNLLRNTAGYKQLMNPIIEQMEQERERLIESMANTELDKVHYRDKTKALDTLTKNMQLLTGKPTAISQQQDDMIIDAEVVEVIEEAEDKVYQRLIGNE